MLKSQQRRDRQLSTRSGRSQAFSAFPYGSVSMLWQAQGAAELFFCIMNTKPKYICSALCKFCNPTLPRRMRYVTDH